VYLRPLIDDLKMLWAKEGVPVWDDVDGVYPYKTSFGLASDKSSVVIKGPFFPQV
jgi:hypothetical protein